MPTALLRLRNLDGSKLGAVALEIPLERRWELVAEIVSEEHRCHADDVAVDEGEPETPDEGMEFLTVRGERVGYLEEDRGIRVPAIGLGRAA